MQVCATLENLTNLHLSESDDWHFKVKCTQCNETSENFVYFNLVEKNKIEGSKGEAHYIAKCKFCDRFGNVEYLPNTWKTYSKSEQWQTIASFECRNMELVEFNPGMMKAQGTGNDGDTHFDDVDLSKETDWAGFDEGADQAVGVYEFKSQIIRS